MFFTSFVNNIDLSKSFNSTLTLSQFLSSRQLRCQNSDLYSIPEMYRAGRIEQEQPPPLIIKIIDK